MSANAPGAPVSDTAGCKACWGLEAPTLGQTINTVVNHLFNSTFSWLATLPGGPFSNLLEGALVLVRRSLFLSPLGVTATQVGNELTVAVNTGSVAYFRQDGTSVEVSGLPTFGAAKKFDAVTVEKVTVANPGNAGCAGLVADSGLISAALTTTEIDSIRFNPDAAFGEVTATVTGGPLTIRDAVRGLGGVTLEGAVILGNDVEVDAGSGNAEFKGTVDAAKAGEQSLTVTALGTTTFDAAVGGQSPLASLLTRGVTPLNLPQADGITKTIPLYYMPQYSGAGQSEVKYGIDVAIGDNPARTFVFDTGGNAFFAGYNPDFWKGVPLTEDQVKITYTSGNYYDAVVANAIVKIGPDGGPQVSTAQPVEIGAILNGGNNKTGQTFSFTDPNAAPVDGRFAGDFGAAFGLQPSVSGDTNLTSVLFQLPGNLHTGFVVQLGPIGTDPSLTVGITDAMRAQFPYAIPVAALSGAGTYPVSGYQVLQQFGFYPQYFVASPDGLIYPVGTEPFLACATQCLPTLIDSGAPSTNVRLPVPADQTPFYPLSTSQPGSDQPGSLKPGSKFIAKMPTTLGRPPLEWTFIAGNNGSVNEVNYSSGSGAATTTQNVNTGLNLYNGYDVMFDTEKQVIWLRPNGGQSTVSVKSVTTTGDQNFQQNAVLGGTYSSATGDVTVGGVATLRDDTVVNAGSGDVTFFGTVDDTTSNGHSLTVNSTGATTFVREVGSQVALDSLTTDQGGSTASAGVITQRDQKYNDDVKLSGPYQVNEGDFTVKGSADLAGPVTVTTSQGDITFERTIDGMPEQGFTLGLITNSGQTTVKGAVGGKHAVGGLVFGNSGGASATPSTVTMNGEVKVDGSVVNAGSIGIFIGDNVTADLSGGGKIEKFTTSGVVFQGGSRNSTVSGFEITGNVYDGIQIAAAGGTRQYDYSGTTISGNTIFGNSAFGIETVAPVTGLTIENNTIGAVGTANKWDYVSGGPNTHGIVLAPGLYNLTINDNTIVYNSRSAIFAPGGVQGVGIEGNTLSSNGVHGIEFTNGDFTNTKITKNDIENNGSDGIALGAGIGQADTTKGDNPLTGYSSYDGHYVLSYVDTAENPAPDFYDPKTWPADPKIDVQIGSKKLPVNLDTGSRGLYFDALSLDSDILDNGVLGPGHVYLNSSNRLYFGQWVQTAVNFPDSYYVKGGVADRDLQAAAEIPVLVVQAIGASTTPMPGQTQATATFGTTISKGFITLTDGSKSMQAPIIENPSNPGTGTVTIPGGFYAVYSDNTYTDEQGNSQSKLAAVANFGVGFDRSGEGTEPTDDNRNQAYNAFLNLTEMRDGSMRAGYVISATGVILGLDSTVKGFGYTDLVPTGLDRDSNSPPDWQPATGSVSITRTIDKVTTTTTYDTGPLVLDLGYGGGILTLPGADFIPPAAFAEKVTVNLLNSTPKDPQDPNVPRVSYDVTPTNGEYKHDNLLNPNGIELFNPLAGTYSQNTPPLSQQFFNTSRSAFAAFQYLYDADGGHLGLKVDEGDERRALETAKGVFDANYYKNPNAPTGVTNLTIEDNTIANNGTPTNIGDGVLVNGSATSGVSIQSNSIYGNSGRGIALTNGANNNQKAPVMDSAAIAGGQLTVGGSLPDGSGQYLYQVFASPATSAGNVQGQTYLGEFIGGSTFSGTVDAATVQKGDRITMTATPTDLLVAVVPNTSEFSIARIV